MCRYRMEEDQEDRLEDEEGMFFKRDEPYPTQNRLGRILPSRLRDDPLSRY